MSMPIPPSTEHGRQIWRDAINSDKAHPNACQRIFCVHARDLCLLALDELDRQGAVIEAQDALIEAQKKYAMGLEAACDYSRSSYWAERHFRIWIAAHGRRNSMAHRLWLDLRTKRTNLKYALKCMSESRKAFDAAVARMEEVKRGS